MLKSLRISNFALIERLDVEWTVGLNVLTGETGAGKSILIDAISLLLGSKAGPSFIRQGAEKAQIEGIFCLSPTVTNWLKEQELDETATDELVISREISKSSSRFRLNGIIVNQSQIQELRQLLIHIHAQDEARTLLSPQSQLEMLDALGDEKHHQLLTQLRNLYTRYKSLNERLRNIQISEEERLRRLDFAQFQYAELAEASLGENDEDEHLAEQAEILSHIALLESSATEAQKALREGEADTPEGRLPIAAIDLIQLALTQIERASKFDQKLERIILLLRSSLADLEEASQQLRQYSSTLENDPQTLEEVRARLALLSTIKRKYGPTLKEVLERQSLLAQEIETLTESEIQLALLSEELQTVNKELTTIAQQLSKRRQDLAQELSQHIKTELADLGMERCLFSITFEALPEIGPNGEDRVEFMIAPNPGQPLLPLAKIASGGELSRIMLAIKSIFAACDQVATVIFDEIDTGLSGRILQVMKDKLSQLARSHQILCITHQPVIAAVANNYLQISKEQSKQNTKVSVKVLLEEKDRLKSLAAMASGREDEEIALNFARSLMAESKSVLSN